MCVVSVSSWQQVSSSLQSSLFSQQSSFSFRGTSSEHSSKIVKFIVMFGKKLHLDGSRSRECSTFPPHPPADLHRESQSSTSPPHPPADLHRESLSSTSPQAGLQLRDKRTPVPVGWQLPIAKLRLFSWRSRLKLRESNLVLETMICPASHSQWSVWWFKQQPEQGTDWCPLIISV